MQADVLRDDIDRHGGERNDKRTTPGARLDASHHEHRAQNQARVHAGAARADRHHFPRDEERALRAMMAERRHRESDGVAHGKRQGAREHGGEPREEPRRGDEHAELHPGLASVESRPGKRNLSARKPPSAPMMPYTRSSSGSEMMIPAASLT
jgi:hypothetical protein